MLADLDAFLADAGMPRTSPRTLGEYVRGIFAPGARVSEGGARRAQIFQDDDGAIVDPGPAEPAPMAKGRFAPRDECADVEGAAAFRDRLTTAIAARDDDALVALAASDVVLDFGGGGGTAHLRELLHQSGGALWDEVKQLKVRLQR